MVNVMNIHERSLRASRAQVADLVASLAAADDRLWPRQWWPAMRFDRALQAGAVGGHGPIRYTIETYVPGEKIIFRFTAPRGFDGTHAYFIEPVNADTVRLRHVLAMRLTGPALLSWPLVFRPLHDALIEDSLDVAAAQITGMPLAARPWSAYVRLLRALLRRPRRPTAQAARL